MGKKAGKGALIQEEVSATLGVSQDQTLFQPVVIATLEGNGTRESHRGSGINEGGVQFTLNSVERHAVAYVTFEPGIARREGGHIYEDVCGTLRAKAGDNQMAVAYAIENHPNDSRVNIDESGTVQTLTSRCGTGGGNVPLVMFSKVRRAQSADDFETWGGSEVTNTLNNFDNGDVRTTECVICMATQQGGAERSEAYSVGNGQLHQVNLSDKVGALNCMHDQQMVMVASFYPQMKAESQCYRDDGVANTVVIGTNPGFQNGVVIALDRASYNQGQNAQYDFSIDEGGVAQTIVAKGPGAVCYKTQSEASVQPTQKE